MAERSCARWEHIVSEIGSPSGPLEKGVTLRISSTLIPLRDGTTDELLSEDPPEELNHVFFLETPLALQFARWWVRRLEMQAVMEDPVPTEVKYQELQERLAAIDAIWGNPLPPWKPPD